MRNISLLRLRKSLCIVLRCLEVIFDLLCQGSGIFRIFRMIDSLAVGSDRPSVLPIERKVIGVLSASAHRALHSLRNDHLVRTGMTFIAPHVFLFIYNSERST